MAEVIMIVFLDSMSMISLNKHSIFGNASIISNFPSEVQQNENTDHIVITITTNCIKTILLGLGNIK